MRRLVAGADGQRGYTPFGKEHAKDAKIADLKEFWHVGREFAPSLAAREYLSDRMCGPQAPAGFRDTFLNLYTALEDAGFSMLEALAPSLGVSADYFRKMATDGNSILRLLHYPPVPKTPTPGALRAAAHEDINLITILVAANGGGLELLDRDGTWLPVETDPDNLIVDAGDMLARVTNDVIPATTHRVVNAPGRARLALLHALLHAPALGRGPDLHPVLQRLRREIPGHHSGRVFEAAAEGNWARRERRVSIATVRRRHEAIVRSNSAPASFSARSDTISARTGPIAILKNTGASWMTGVTFVAVKQPGTIAGFAMFEPMDGDVHLVEIDVDPDHQQKGLARRLIAIGQEWSLSKGFDGMTLTTYRDVPWNAPFYRRLGFVDLEPDASRPGLLETVRKKRRGFCARPRSSCESLMTDRFLTSSSSAPAIMGSSAPPISRRRGSRSE